MNESSKIAGIKVPKADWDTTPPSIQAALLGLHEPVATTQDYVQSQSVVH